MGTRTGSLATLAWAANSLSTVIPEERRRGMKAGALNSAAKDLARDHWAVDAVAKAVRDAGGT